MSEDMFDIIFTGDIVGGADLALVKQKAAQIFRLSDTKTEVLFSGKPTALKKNVDQSAVSKYQRILTGIGMITVVQPHSEKSCEKPVEKSEHTVSYTAPSVKPMPAPVIKPTVESAVASSVVATTPSPARELTVLPVGSLIASEVLANNSVAESAKANAGSAEDTHVSHIEVPDWEIDKPGTVLAESANTPINKTYDGLSEVSLAPLAADLLTDNEKITPPTLPPLTSIENITVAQSGEDLLNTSERSEFMESSIDTSHLSASSSGGELLAEHEKRVFVETPLDTSTLRLSDVDL
ncbi:MAG: hypothetical protein ACJAZJ_001515 [Candidatus Endobugula sp.]|jgi:hypothetical protein